MARANTAAIKVEKLAADATDSSSADQRPDVEVETDAAIYKDGKVTLKGNPLKTTREILCPKCLLPRLLYPTDGKGGKKPDPSLIYCKRHPYIEKPGFDIYGQTWVAPGPGRGKKKKDLKDKLDPNDPSSPAPVMEGSAKDRPPNVLSFPSATCSKCKRCILVTRLNNHMGSCIGNSGRNASRAAAQKLSNSNSGSQNNDNTPPGSQKGTPLPTSRAASPRKRDGDEFDEDNNKDGAAAEEEESTNPKKKKLKTATLNKKVILKAKSPAAPTKKDKLAKGASMLNVEQKAADIDGKDSTTTPAAAPTAAKNAAPAAAKNATPAAPKISAPAASKISAPAVPKTAAPKKSVPKASSPAKKIKLNNNTPIKPPPIPPPQGGKRKKDKDLQSESSGTLSSPPH
ncbi:hypothetical protein QBC38DRAFT_470958 [Podospora fimiseda]|uniref:Transcriptional activator n=1 Tax=Podospora fimiseda TaxID=252190 RepID=A0AAN7BVY2_9PEZI|nr:hypothetical protein QBC38DRAFT_470958 [Podospora fimiseda]